MSANSTITAALQLIGRALFAYMFIYAGYGKIGAQEGLVGYISAHGLPMPVVAYWAAVLVELVGGILVLIGLFARPAALAIGIFSIVAGVAFHLHDATGDAANVMNQMIHFSKNLSIAGGAFVLAAVGAGKWSLDAKIFGGNG